MSDQKQGIFSGIHSWSVKSLDIFALLNIILFFLLCYFAYFDRFVKYRGYQYIWEFFVYALIIIFLVLFAWKTVRHIDVPVWLLAATEIGILMHFAGGLAFFGEQRIYDTFILGIRYDKYVHLFNAIIATFYVQRIPCKHFQQRTWFGAFVTILMVLGMGALVEIIEYMVMLTVKVNGVGSYDNNMQDLIANFTGVTLCVLVMSLIQKLKPENRQAYSS
jgi:hypothetical protein